MYRAFARVCVIEADLSSAYRALRKRSAGPNCWSLEFDIVLFFGGTELSAAVSWRDAEVSGGSIVSEEFAKNLNKVPMLRKGVVHRGGAVVLPSQYM